MCESYTLCPHISALYIDTKKQGSLKGQKRQATKELGTSQTKKSRTASVRDKENLLVAKAQVRD